MTYTFEQFCNDCHEILVDGADDAALDEVRGKLEKLLVNPEFVAETFTPDTPYGRRELYHDPDTGFYILAHVQKKRPERGSIHSHGSSWAVYGNAWNATEMVVWRRTNPESDDHAELAIEDDHTIAPGTARAYGPGVIHSTAQPDKAYVIRVTGTDLDKLPRFRFDPARDKILAEA
jgi:hypothetical protein